MTLGAVLVALTFVLPGSQAWGRTLGLLAVVCFVGAECRVAVWPVPPAAGPVVVPATMLVIPGPATVVVVLAVPVAAGHLMLATSPRTSVLWSLPFLAGTACPTGVWATVGASVPSASVSAFRRASRSPEHGGRRRGRAGC